MVKRATNILAADQIQKYFYHRVVQNLAKIKNVIEVPVVRASAEKTKAIVEKTPVEKTKVPVEKIKQRRPKSKFYIMKIII